MNTRHSLVPVIFVILLIIPVYWLVKMSFQTTHEIRSAFSIFPEQPTLGNYAIIFSDSSWYLSYFDALAYVVMNVIISIGVALPAAYAFSRYRFIGDRHMFFWFLVYIL